MTEKVVTNIEVSRDKRCSNCVLGHEIVALGIGGNISNDGIEIRNVSNGEIRIGQTRNCFNWFQWTFEHPPKYVSPHEDDTCINPRKFK